MVEEFGVVYYVDFKNKKYTKDRSGAYAVTATVIPDLDSRLNRINRSVDRLNTLVTELKNPTRTPEELDRLLDEMEKDRRR